MAALVVLTIAALSGGCTGACAEAADLCKECELRTDDCDARFDDASSEYCEGAVTVYERSCPALE